MLTSILLVVIVFCAPLHAWVAFNVTSIPTVGGIIIIHGNFTENLPDISEINIYDKNCTNIAVLTTTIQCHMPPGVGGGFPVTFLFNDSSSALLNASFSYERPIVYDRGILLGSRAHVETIPIVGKKMFLMGNNFGNDTQYVHFILSRNNRNWVVKDFTLQKWPTYVDPDATQIGFSLPNNFQTGVYNATLQVGPPGFTQTFNFKFRVYGIGYLIGNYVVLFAWVYVPLYVVIWLMLHNANFFSAVTFLFVTAIHRLRHKKTNVSAYKLCGFNGYKTLHKNSAYKQEEHGVIMWADVNIIGDSQGTLAGTAFPAIYIGCYLIFGIFIPTLLTFIFPGAVVLIVEGAFGFAGSILTFFAFRFSYQQRQKPTFGLFFISSNGLYYMKSTTQEIEKIVSFDSSDMGVDRAIFRQESSDIPPIVATKAVFQDEGTHIINEMLKAKAELKTINVEIGYCKG